VDGWGQTEAGVICFASFSIDKAYKQRPFMIRPFFGMDFVLLDENGAEQEKFNSRGALCIKKPWPAMARTVYGDHERYIQAYLKPYKGYYFTGDAASTDEFGFFRMNGRLDDVIKVR
jgi:acetyl-CoA synthetase